MSEASYSQLHLPRLNVYTMHLLFDGIEFRWLYEIKKITDVISFLFGQFSTFPHSVFLPLLLFFAQFLFLLLFTGNFSKWTSNFCKNAVLFCLLNISRSVRRVTVRFRHGDD
jgi:hypothetical protein